MRSSNVLEAEAIRFFEQYCTEFDSCRWHEFASLFHEPCLTVRGNGTVIHLNSRTEAAPFFESVAKAWQEEGYHRFTMANFEIFPIGINGMLVTFDWNMLDKDACLIRNWRQSYQLIRADEKLQVMTSMFHAG